MGNDLNMIKERLNNTTKGNWKFGKNGTLHSTETNEHLMYVGRSGDIIMKYVDMQFIENAKKDVSYLLLEAEKLNEIRKLLTKEDMTIFEFGRNALAILEDIKMSRRNARI